MRVLIIEDNTRMSAQITEALESNGYAVDVAHRGVDGEHKASVISYDAIVLDMMLPDCTGLDVCRALRRRNVRAPILMLTALSDTPEKVAGLNAGADDYLTKPFEFDELLARLRALLRRGSAAEGAVLRVGEIELELSERKALIGGRSIRLGARELGVLEYLMRRAGSVVTRSELYEHVWNESFDPNSNLMDVYVSTLRRHLRDNRSGASIQTVIGVGYKLDTSPEGPIS